MKISTVRELIYWEWSKLVAERISGSRRDYAMVQYTRDPFDWYGKERRDEIPRIVVGKYLKLIYEKHEALGTLDTGSAGDGPADLRDLMRAFDCVSPSD